MYGRYCVLVLLAACTTGDNAVPSTLVATVAEPPGDNCTYGGVAVESGRDNNDNGVLDASEVTATTYACAPPGAAQPVDSVVSEPPGAHCPNGGEAINVGLDLNNNGVLDTNEITHTTYLCNAPEATVIEGSLTVQNAMQAAQLIGIQRITGDLVIDAPGLTTLDLSSLVEVDGDLHVANYNGSTLSLPALTTVGRTFQIDPWMAISLGALVSTGGSLYVNGNSLTAPNLTTVGNSLYLYNLTSDVNLPLLASEGHLVSNSTTGPTVSVPQLLHGHDVNFNGVTLDAPALTDVDFLTLTAISDVHLPALTSAPSIILNQSSLTTFPFSQIALTNVVMDHDANAITLSSAQTAMGSIKITNGPVSLSLPNLRTLDWFMVSESSTTTTLGLPALQLVNYLDLDNDASLTTLAFPALTSAGSVYIEANPSLSQCAAASFAAALAGNGTRSIIDNGPC